MLLHEQEPVVQSCSAGATESEEARCCSSRLSSSPAALTEDCSPFEISQQPAAALSLLYNSEAAAGIPAVEIMSNRFDMSSWGEAGFISPDRSLFAFMPEIKKDHKQCTSSVLFSEQHFEQITILAVIILTETSLDPDVIMRRKMFGCNRSSELN